MNRTSFSYIFYQTPAGTLKVTMSSESMCEAIFVDGVDAKLSAPLVIPKLLMQGTDFQKKVWEAALQIPAGTTITYQELAANIGQPNAYRAVANALGSNKIAYFIPCHRVIRKNGKLGGYRWGLARKEALLAFERASN